MTSVSVRFGRSSETDISRICIVSASNVTDNTGDTVRFRHRQSHEAAGRPVPVRGAACRKFNLCDLLLLERVSTFPLCKQWILHSRQVLGNVFAKLCGEISWTELNGFPPTDQLVINN